MNIPVALQLYSVKEDTAKDFVSTLERIAKIGYQGVEFAGYGDIPAHKMKQQLTKLGLRPAGSHVSVERLKNALQQEIDYNLEIGNKNIVCPYHIAKTTNEYMELCELLNKTGEVLETHGMRLYYHNHGHEFEWVDGTRGLDVIWQNTAPKLVRSELDLFWVDHAGVSPQQYLKQLGSRAGLLHLKDMSAADRNQTVELGEGCIDYQAILRQIKTDTEFQVEWLIIEQEHFDKPYLDSMEIGYHNLTKMMDEVWR